MKENIIKRAIRLITRNNTDEDGNRFKRNRVNLVYWRRKTNLGDALAPIIVTWMLEKKGLSLNDKTKRTQRLLTIGSILDLGRFDATVWCSGAQSFRAVQRIMKRRYRRLDIRAVRGPISKEIMEACGYDCPSIYGDPAVLMPQIYRPEKGNARKEDICVIMHHSSVQNPDVSHCSQSIRQINILTDDYQSFVNEITSARKVISSSLHGIILAEVYGIPTVFLAPANQIEMLKYYDWYRSTGRDCVYFAKTLDEAIEMEPMVLPTQEILEKMCANIIDAFPYDLWN